MHSRDSRKCAKRHSDFLNEGPRIARRSSSSTRYPSSVRYRRFSPSSIREQSKSGERQIPAAPRNFNRTSRQRRDADAQLSATISGVAECNARSANLFRTVSRAVWNDGNFRLPKRAADNRFTCEFRRKEGVPRRMRTQSDERRRMHPTKI